MLRRSEQDVRARTVAEAPAGPMGFEFSREISRTRFYSSMPAYRGPYAILWWLFGPVQQRESCRGHHPKQPKSKTSHYESAKHYPTPPCMIPSMRTEI